MSHACLLRQFESHHIVPRMMLSERRKVRGRERDQGRVAFARRSHDVLIPFPSTRRCPR